MKLKKLMITLGAVTVLSACSSTTVVKDVSGPQVVDVMYSKFAQEVTTALNRLADVEDMNKVNVMSAYNTNSQPINKSYNGTVSRQNRIVIPDTYPQTAWRNDGVATSVEDAKKVIQATAEQQAAKSKAEAEQLKKIESSSSSSAQTSTTSTQEALNHSVKPATLTTTTTSTSIRAAAGTQAPSRFNCPTGSTKTVRQNMTICEG